MYRMIHKASVNVYVKNYITKALGFQELFLQKYILHTIFNHNDRCLYANKSILSKNAKTFLKKFILGVDKRV